MGSGPPPLPKRPQPSGLPITPVDPDRQHHFYQGDRIHKGVPPLPKQAPGLMDQLGKFLGADVLAAAGPIGAVALGAQQLTTQLEAMRKTVGRVTEGLEGLAQNQLPSARGFGDAIADFQETIPIIGQAMAAQTRLLLDIAQLPEKLSAAFLNRAHQLAPYSGVISSAEAIRDVRTIQADIREARELGHDMARMVDAQSRLDQTVRELLLPIKKVIVEVLADRLEMLLSIATDIKNSGAGQAIAGAISGASPPVAFWGGLLSGLSGIQTSVDELKPKPAAEALQIWDDFLKDMENAELNLGGRGDV